MANCGQFVAAIKNLLRLPETGLFLQFSDLVFEFELGCIDHVRQVMWLRHPPHTSEGCRRTLPLDGVIGAVVWPIQEPPRLTRRSGQG